MNPMSSITPSAAGLSAALHGLPPVEQSREPAAPFSSLLKDAVGKVDGLEDQAHTAVLGLMTGQGVDVHQAVIATQKADMAFELALSVRNKAVQAYQSVMNMQF